MHTHAHMCIYMHTLASLLGAGRGEKSDSSREMMQMAALASLPTPVRDALIDMPLSALQPFLGAAHGPPQRERRAATAATPGTGESVRSFQSSLCVAVCICSYLQSTRFLQHRKTFGYVISWVQEGVECARLKGHCQMPCSALCRQRSVKLS